MSFESVARPVAVLPLSVIFLFLSVTIVQLSSANEVAPVGVNFKAKETSGVIDVPNVPGLQYRVLASSTTPDLKPSKADIVEVHYKGILATADANGGEVLFDSSYQRGSPARFPVNGVIQGWVEILQLMSPGDKWEVYIPSNLAYGARGAGAAIGPNADLIFIVELISIEQRDL